MRGRFVLVLASLLLVTALALARSAPSTSQDTVAPRTDGCLACHVGIESMHPEAELSCVDCHGGDANARSKKDAHVASSRTEAPDERVAPLDDDLAWRRFVNPMDLRVAPATCGRCHARLVEHLQASLHGTTAGHLSDGYYEVGAKPTRGAEFSVFPVRAPGGSTTPYTSFRQVPPFDDRRGAGDLATHYGDLARKECLQCHLWSAGRAVRGRVGFDGDYRGEGCAACHVEYARDGLSQSADRSVNHTEPGHARVHAMQRAATTDTCTSCHYGDASIGTNFRGLAQLPPGAPGGPEIPGTTREPLNRQYYLSDPAVAPPDVHHERGMHCVDCHTLRDVMGDGQLHGNMEHQVEITCEACHGTFTERSTLLTERGERVTNLRREGDRVILRSKVTGADHDVVQVVDVLDPRHPRHDPRAAAAMNASHGQVECHACHASWNPNFLGFHFDRNESLSQLDLLTGRRTPGRVTTQEKVFATWKGFYAGRDERGRIEPYLTGFSTMGSVTDARGERVLDQALPVTAEGLSGMTMIHHQMHTTRPTARSCVECHRAPGTWGLGTVNFQLARQLAFVADRRGVEVVALDRTQLAASVPLAKLAQPDVTCLEIRADPLRGFATELFVGEGSRGVHVIDVRAPTAPARLAFVATVDPQDLVVRGDHLYVADGAGGLRVFDVSTPAAPVLLGVAPMLDARAVHVQWPWAYVADGAGGLVVVDVRAPIAPRVVGGLDLRDDDGSAPSAIDVSTLFQYGRPRSRKAPDGTEKPLDERTPARHLCAVLDETRGLILVDVTEPTRPVQLHPPSPRPGRPRPAREDVEWRGLAIASHVDLAQPQGGTRTTERDYVYLVSERATPNQPISTVSVVDVTDPARPRRVGQSNAGESSESLTLASFYNPPFLQTVLFTCGDEGVYATDATVSTQPAQLGALGGSKQSYVIAVESFPLDRMLDERGRRTKDVSHAGSRWLLLPEIERVLSVPAEALGTRGASLPGAWTLGPARAEYARLDADRSGVVDGDEATRLAQADADTDGRVSLREFAAWSRALPPEFRPTAVAAETTRVRASRVDPDGDLARLLDLIDPQRFDRDGDGRLARTELDAAWFAALDLDGDRALTPAELSRQPGETRRIRHGGAAAGKLLARVDRDANGRVTAGECRVPDDAWTTLDADGDDFVQLARRRGGRAERAGRATAAVEWPSRRTYQTRLSPLVKSAQVLAVFDTDGDRKLTRKELEKRPDLLHDMDDDGNGSVEFDELDLRARVTIGAGVDVVPDGFLERWDLDGDGRVSPSEMSVPTWLRARLGLDAR